MSNMPTAEDYCFMWNNQTLYPSTDVNKRYQHHASPNQPTECHLVGAFFPDEAMQFVNDPNVYICSSSNRLVFLILRYLRCSVDILLSNQNYGGSKVNGTWTGVLSLLAQKKADFIPHVFSLIGKRDEVIHYDFMMPQRELITILSHPKQIDSQSPLKMFKCFTSAVWLSIASMFLVIGLIYSFNSDRYLRSLPRKGEGWWHRLASSYTTMFAMSIGQGSVPLGFKQIRFLSNPLHLYIFIIFLIRILFSSDITAALLSQEKTIIDRFDQLEEMPKLKILIQAGSSTQTVFNHKFPSLVKQTIEIKNAEVGTSRTLFRLMQEDCVLVINGYHGETLEQHFSAYNLHLSIEGYSGALNNYAIRKTLGQLERQKLARLFRFIFYFGIELKMRPMRFLVNNFQALYRTSYANQSLEELMVAVQREKKINLNGIHQSDRDRASTHMIVCLYTYSFGVSIAFACLIIEYLVHRLCA